MIGSSPSKEQLGGIRDPLLLETTVFFARLSLLRTNRGKGDTYSFFVFAIDRLLLVAGARFDGFLYNNCDPDQRRC